MGQAKRRKQNNPNFGKPKPINLRLSQEHLTGMLADGHNPEDFPQEQQRLQQELLSRGEVEGVKFLILNPVKDDFLAAEEVLKGVIRSAWCPHPGKAIKFFTFDKAYAKALELVKDKGNILQVCELTETETQFKVEVVVEIKL